MLLGGAYWDRGLSNDDAVLFQGLADISAYVQYMLRVGAAIFIRRSADSDEDKLTCPHCLSDVSGEAKASFMLIGDHQLLQAGFVTRRPTLLQALNSFAVHVHANGVVAHVGITCAGYQTHISSADNGNLHRPLRTF